MGMSTIPTETATYTNGGTTSVWVGYAPIRLGKERCIRSYAAESIRFGDERKHKIPKISLAIILTRYRQAFFLTHTFINVELFCSQINDTGKELKRHRLIQFSL